MNKSSNLKIGLLLAAVLAVSAWQGQRIQHLRESEMFFRWIIGESARARMFADTQTLEQENDGPKMMDSELLQRVSDAAQDHLRDVSVPDDVTDKEKGTLSKLVLVAASESQEKTIWDLVCSDVLAAEREDFLKYSREKKLSSVASVFDTEAVYTEGGASVNIGNIFLGFRKIAANFVWLQVDKYWHEGLLFRMVPLMKTCVMLDPTFVDAYLMGAWHLAYNIPVQMDETPEPLKKYYPQYKARLGDKELYYYVAADFLKDGIRKNPRNYKLYFDLGYTIYNLKLKDYANSVKYLSEAIRNKHDKWVPRMLYIAMELNGQFEEAQKGWEKYLENEPENATAKRFIIRNRGRIEDRKADEALSKVADAATPEEAQAARERAYALQKEAVKVWEEMGGPDGEDDPYAAARIMRLKAKRMLQQERYVEAVAILEHARFTSSEFFEEASGMIIEAKQKADIPLSLSEKLAIARREEAARYLEESKAQAEAEAKMQQEANTQK